MMVSSSTSLPADPRVPPHRIRLARQRRGLSKVALASALGVTTRVVQTYETDGAPAARLELLASALGVRPGFLTRTGTSEVRTEQGYFRALRRATAAQLGAARASATVGVELYDWIAERFTLPPVGLPDLDLQDPESAAEALRGLWGRGEEPLPNLVQLSESHGVRVLTLPRGADTVDAFSFWHDGIPYVFLSTTKTAERSRFDLAHELGHLTMHSRLPTDNDATDGGTRQLERDADAFASALLMPARSVLAHSGREPAVPEILRLRDHYKVSAMAMTRRLHDLGRLTDWGYRQNCVALSQRGFRSAEPGGISRERSRVFATVFPALRSAGTTTRQLTEEVGLPPSDLHDLVFGQLPVALG